MAELNRALFQDFGLPRMVGSDRMEGPSRCYKHRRGLIAWEGESLTIPQEPLYREIPLTQGQVALVDAAGYDWLMQWKWSAWWSPSSRSFYAIRAVRLPSGKSQTIRMHRVVLELEPSDRRLGDHRNHNTLDNRRRNLRVADKMHNNLNQRIRADNELGCKGVSVRRARKKWRYCSQIQVKGKKIHLGYFPFTPEGFEDAKQAYQRAAENYFGEFAFLDVHLEGQRKPDRPIPEFISKAETWSQRVRVDSPTGRKGVSIANGKAYRSLFQAGGKRMHLGYFPLTPEGLERASAVCQLAADLHFGNVTI